MKKKEENVRNRKCIKWLMIVVQEKKAG